MRGGFFKNKTVLITGHTGFKGSWLSLWLDTLGANIIGFSLNPPSRPYLYPFLKFNGEIINIRGDIRKLANISKVIRDYEPQIVFHLAALPILRISYEFPVDTYITNTVGTLNLLEAVRKFGKANAVINVTTDKVYANIGKKHAYKENEKLGGDDPYSSSKACSELITQSYQQSFFSGIGVATARAGNVMGGGDWGKFRIIPYLLSSHVQNRTLKIRKTDKDDVRPWTFIFDVLNGYLSLGEKLYERPKRYSGGWNFGSGYVKTVMNLVNGFSAYWPIKYKIVKSDIQEEEMLLLDSTKSEEELGWKPLIDFREGVKETAYWYSNFYKNHSKDFVTNYSLERLADFKKRLYG